MRRLSLAWLLVLFFSPMAAAADQPNIILILADDLGYSDLGCYGGEIPTPNLDRLAARGLRFTQFYNCTRCCPTRASLLTGLYPHMAGVGWMTADQGQPGYRGSPQPNTVTLAEVLRSAGYQTLMCGKWHLSPGPKGRPTPIDRGFDEYYGMIEGFRGFWDPKGYGRHPTDRPARTYPPGGFYATDAFTDHALDFVGQADKNRPFFLYLAYTAPHFPLHARKEDIARHRDRYAGGWDQLRQERYARMVQMGLIDPRWRLAPRSPYETREDFYRTGDNPAWDTLPADRRADLARRMAVYAAMVERMDWNIGRVVDALGQSGRLDNTLIFFLSDNGACAEWDPFGFDGGSGPKNTLHQGEALETMGQPGSYHSYGSGWANASNTPFRWYKHYGHEGGIATPLIVHWPRRIPEGGGLRRQVGHVVDIMATCVEVSGALYPKQRLISKPGPDPQRPAGVLQPITPMAGKSLIPALADQPLEREYLAWEHERNRAIRQGKWKLVALHGQPWELYDLEADRTELHDLAAAMPDRVRAMSALWDAWARENQVVPYPEPAAKNKPPAKP